MNVLIPNLHKDRSTLTQQIPRNRQPIPQIRQIRVNPVPPRIPERLHLLRLAADVFGFAVLHVPARRRPLEVRVELDAVGRVEVDALHLAAQPLALGERRHHLQAVAEDHPVRPVGVVLIELGAGVFARQAVEIGEQVDLEPRLAREPLRLRRLAVSQQVVDQRLRMHLLLDEERRRLHHQVRPVLPVLAAPDELRVQVAVSAFVRNLDRTSVVLCHHGFVLRGGDVLAGGCVVNKHFNAPGCSSLGHCVTTPPGVPQRPRNCASSTGMSV